MFVVFFTWIFSAINVWILGVATLLLCIRWWKKPHPDFPPGRRGLPFFGVLPYLGDYPQEVLRKWALFYGPIMFVRMGGKDVVFLNTTNSINEAFVKQSHVFSGRPKIRLYNQVLDHNGITYRYLDYNEKQKFSKKFALQSLRRLGLGTSKMENVISSETQIFVQYLSERQNQPLDLEVELSGILCNIMTTLVIGKRFEYDDSVLKILLKDGVFKSGDSKLKLILMYFYKYVHFIPPFRGTNQRFIKAELRAADTLRVFIEEHKERFDPSDVKDFVDMFLYERKFGSGKHDHILTDRQLEGCVRDVILAGSNDLRLLLLWDILCLLNYPDYYAKIVQEIDAVIGPSTPTVSHMKQMPLTHAFLQEIWRYCPAVPNGVLHITSADTMLNGFHIPKGTNVVPNIYAAHFDPDVWKNPKIFDPQRHIDDDGNCVRSTKIIPCSVGPRFCLGRDIAHDEEFIILATLLQKFHITPASTPLPPISTGFTTLVYSPHKYKVTVTER